MLRAAVICADEQVCRDLSAIVPKVAGLEVARAITKYPTPEELLRTIRVRRLDLVLLCVDDFTHAELLVKTIDNVMPGFPVITLSKGNGIELFQKLMHLGIREHLTSPIQASSLLDAVAAVNQRLKSRPTPAPNLGDLYTFLPAKPGVGASTIAMSTSCALADDLAVKTLLMDCDLAAGTIQFLLKLGATASVVDALMHADALDEDMWLDDRENGMQA